jgi:hypothetical protein
LGPETSFGGTCIQHNGEEYHRTESILFGVRTNTIHGIELEVETFRVLAAQNGDRTEGILPRLISIENLEETQISALERTA